MIAFKAEMFGLLLEKLEGPGLEKVRILGGPGFGPSPCRLGCGSALRGCASCSRLNEKVEGPGFEKSRTRGSACSRGWIGPAGDAGCLGGDDPGLNQSMDPLGDRGRGAGGETASLEGSGLCC